MKTIFSMIILGLLSAAQIVCAQYLGEVHQIGRTWQDNQHNGTVGSMIDRDAENFIQAAWTNCLDSSSIMKLVYWNVVDSQGVVLHPDGFSAITERSSMVTQALHQNGNSVLAFHSTAFGVG
ncbi:MAG: hypothetical protein ABH878_01225, partial [bacterium]